jgi:predicted ribosomally synthesized peptide with SipW-like signal peptide
MSKKTKRYLMLLVAVGLIAVAAGGSGTFASFNAETTNTGNTFATGTLILNDKGGTNTCTSASAVPSNFNTGTDCDTLFNVNQFKAANTTTSGSVTSATTSMAVGTINNGVIYKGDTLQITDGTNTDTMTVTATTSATPILVDASGLTHSYSSGAKITDLNPTFLANLTLTNAGSIDASGISYKRGGSVCSASYTEGHSTLDMGTVTPPSSSGTTLTFVSIPVGGFHSGDPVVVHEGVHYQTFVATGTSTGTTVAVTAQNWNFAYTTAAVVSGPEFAGGSPQNLCTGLKLSIVETGSGFDADMSTAAKCATGNITNPVATNACDLSGGTALSALTTNLTSLILSTGGGLNNSGTLLSASGTRYLLLAVHYTGANFDNTFQNTKTTAFDLTWHIDQV